jgi:hypothetical protein
MSTLPTNLKPAGWVAARKLNSGKATAVLLRHTQPTPLTTSPFPIVRQLIDLLTNSEWRVRTWSRDTSGLYVIVTTGAPEPISLGRRQTHAG